MRRFIDTRQMSPPVSDELITRLAKQIVDIQCLYSRDGETEKYFFQFLVLFHDASCNIVQRLIKTQSVTH